MTNHATHKRPVWTIDHDVPSPLVSDIIAMAIHLELPTPRVAFLQSLISLVVMTFSTVVVWHAAEAVTETIHLASTGLSDWHAPLTGLLELNTYFDEILRRTVLLTILIVSMFLLLMCMNSSWRALFVFSALWLAYAFVLEKVSERKGLRLVFAVGGFLLTAYVKSAMLKDSVDEGILQTCAWLFERYDVPGPRWFAAMVLEILLEGYPVYQQIPVEDALKSFVSVIRDVL
ncbi:hypothetical protein M426DRAFT_15426 [Hypoxylon sp. CI-4A]|nr:hypothetical protein M426DRAFT_15426 [Hypoxylon sp. CI-4A]